MLYIFNIIYLLYHTFFVIFQILDTENLQQYCLEFFLRNLPQLLQDNEKFRHMIHNENRVIMIPRTHDKVDFLSLLLTTLIRQLDDDKTLPKCSRF